MKECTACGVNKPLSDYHRNATRRDGHLEQCKVCFNRIGRESYNKEGSQSKKRRVARSKTPRVRFESKANDANRSAKHYGLSGRINRRQVVGMFESHGYCCYYCGVQSDDPKVMTLDHVEPMSKGGENVIQNCVPACWNCNAAKGSQTEQEFLSSRNQGEKA